jgi:hypothetical protein
MKKWNPKFFKARHQKQVDDGLRGNWGFLRVILPFGTDAYATHVTYSMYKDLDQMAKALETGSEGTFVERTAATAGLKTRDLRSVKLTMLIRMVR